MKEMKLVLLGMTLLAAPASGCDGEVKTTTGGAAGSGGETTSSSTGSGGATTGGGGAGGATTSTITRTAPPSGDTLAIHVLRIGDQTPDGMASSKAWAGYGFNLDGKVSTAASVDLCQPSSGAYPGDVYPDGDNGIDNAFGSNLLQLFTALAPDISTQINDAIDAGELTLLNQIEGITPGATGTFLSKLYAGGYNGSGAPAWNGLDAWPVRSDCLVDGDIANPQAQLPMSEVALDASGMRVWQSKGTTDLQLRIPIAGLSMVLTIHHARLTAVLSDDNAKATSGIIGGVLDAEELIAQIALVVASLAPSECPPSATLESIAQQVHQASDILADGTQDPAVVCNGISIGIGFEAEAATLGMVFDAPVAPDPCNP